jgi:transposase
VMVGQWKREIQDRAGLIFEGKRGPKPVDEQSDPERLYSV